MEILHRAARVEDLPECIDVFEESVADLRARLNLATPAQPHPRERLLAFYEHALATGTFRVAEVDGRIGSLACALVRDHLWFLAGFWTRPSLQGQHIGMPALRDAWNAGRLAGVKHFFVWASKDLQAMGAYMKMGMLPGSQILGFAGTPRLLAETPAGYSLKSLKKPFAMAQDKTVLGTSREVDHDFMARAGWRGRQVMFEDKAVGYFYIDGNIIGPASWVDATHAAPLLALACQEALAANPTVSMAVPGMNHAAARFALDAGLRLTEYSHLLMSASFGHLEQYIPSGPALF